MDFELLKKIRAQTGISIAEIKNALLEAGGIEARALELLRMRGSLKAGRRTAKSTGAGILEIYLHPNKRLGVMVEVLCETDFVARNSDFQTLAHDLALQIASMNPLYVSAQDIPKEVADKERGLYREELEQSPKPESIKEQIVEGKFKKYCQEVCLLSQPFVKDEGLTIQQLIEQAIAKHGENIKVGRFCRFEL